MNRTLKNTVQRQAGISRASQLGKRFGRCAKRSPMVSAELQ